MKIERLCLLLALLILSAFMSPKEVLATPYYEGKVIKLIVGHEPGGGYDRMARLLARHLPKHIPGKPTFIVENMPGAGTIIAANHIYSVAKPDGLTLGAIDRGLPIAQLVKGEGVKFDLTKFSWIGSAAVEVIMLCLRSEVPYKTIDDLRKAKEPIYLGSIGQAGDDYQFPTLLKEFVGLNLKFVIYTSSPSINLAIERKEVDGRAGSYTTLKPFIDSGTMRPFIRCRISQEGIENLPVDEDLTTSKIGKVIMAMRSGTGQIGRPYVAPPGVPFEVINILRESFNKVAKDPELKEESKKIRMPVEYVPADECLKVLNFIFTQPDDVAKEFSKYIKF